VTTTTPARLLVLFGDDFNLLRESYPRVAGQLEAAVRERR
jgi:hypothetical protein